MRRLSALLLCLASVAAAGQSANLNWTASPAGGTVNIYRASGACAAGIVFTNIKSGVVAAGPYKDTTISVGSWCYRITAVVGSAESAPTSQVSAVVAPLPPVAVTTGGVTITPAPGVTISNAGANRGHVSFFVSSTQSTNALATVVFNSTTAKYISCGVIPNGDTNYHGLTWLLSPSVNNTLTITAMNALLPGVTFDIHIDCWTS